MSNQEIRYLIKNELQYLHFLSYNSNQKYNNIYDKYKDIIDTEFKNILKTNEKLYCYINKILNIKLCNCGRPLKFISFNIGYQTFCSKSCCSLGSIEKKQKTCMNNFGVLNPSQSTIIKQRKKETCLKNYGVEYSSQSKYVQEKMKNTCFEKFGCTSYFQTEYFLKNHKTYYLSTAAGKEKFKKSMLKKYGVSNPFQINRFEIEDINIRNKLKFGDLFEIELLKFNGVFSEIKIKCKKHGTLKTTFDRFIYSKSGCPFCKSSHGEIVIKSYLDECCINYISQKTFSDCVDKQKLQFDFYLPELNVCIEYDGKQHYEFIEYFHKTQDRFKSQQKRDEIKTEYCKERNIKLIRIPYYEFDNIESILSNLIPHIKS